MRPAPHLLKSCKTPCQTTRTIPRAVRTLLLVLLTVGLLTVGLLAAAACSPHQSVRASTVRAFPPPGGLHVGVLPFKARWAGDGALVADELTVALMRVPGLTFVERTRMVALLDEMGLDPATDFWEEDPNVARRAGVDAFLIGTVSEFDVRPSDFSRLANVAFTARVVDATTGQVLAMTTCAASEYGGDTNLMAQRLAEEVSRELQGLPPQSDQ